MKGELLGIKMNGLNAPEIIWRARSGPKMPSPILVGEEVYAVNDAGILSCLDAKTGSLHWRERLNGQFSASPTYAGGLIYMSDRNGVTHIVKPGKTFNPVSKNEIDGTAHMASFSPYGKSFLVRTEKALYRIEKP